MRGHHPRKLLTAALLQFWDGAVDCDGHSVMERRQGRGGVPSGHRDAPLLLHQSQQPLHGPLLHFGALLQVLSQQQQAHVPEGQHCGGGLERVRAIEVQEDGADEKHLGVEMKEDRGGKCTEMNII